MINSEVWFKFYIEGQLCIPDGLGVRIPDSHSGGPGSIPGQGVFFYSEISVLVDYRLYSIE